MASRLTTTAGRTLRISAPAEGSKGNSRDQPPPRILGGRTALGRRRPEGAKTGLTHHNSEAGLYGKFRIPNKLKLLPYSLATFR